MHKYLSLLAPTQFCSLHINPVILIFVYDSSQPINIRFTIKNSELKNCKYVTIILASRRFGGSLRRNSW